MIPSSVAKGSGDALSRVRATIKPGMYALAPRIERVFSILPNLRHTQAHVLASPQIGARFVQHELHLHPGGGTLKPIADELEHFLFVLEGRLELRLEGTEDTLASGGYAWLPPGRAYEMTNRTDATSRVIWLRRRYLPDELGSLPDALIAFEKDVPALPEDTYLEQHLIPFENPAFDFAMNILNFEPGIRFGSAEAHVMEHGLYILAGEGVYWLNGDFHTVQVDDFIYMAPYCPQYFFSTGTERTRYLLYKDVNRDYTDGL
jgi:(S)-ureidoglycine aminohydrolase